MQRRRKRTDLPVPGAVPYPSDERIMLDSLMREVSEARRGLELDLSLAAGAAAADRTELAVDLVDGSRLRVAALQDTLLDHLAGLHSAGAADDLDPSDLAPVVPLPTRAPAPADAVPGPGWRRALAPLAPLLASAAAVATLLSGSPAPVTSPQTQPMSREAELQAGFDSLGEAVLRRSDEASVLTAVRRLHEAVRPLVVVAGTDPISAATARSVLLRQRELVRSEQPAGARRALSETDVLLGDLGRVGVALPPLQGLLAAAPVPVVPTEGRAPAGRAPRAATPTRPVPSPLPTAAVAPERLVLPLPQLERGSAEPATAPAPAASGGPSSAPASQPAPTPSARPEATDPPSDRPSVPVDTGNRVLPTDLGDRTRTVLPGS